MPERTPAVGDEARLSRTITAADVEDFARISGDTNPVHLDAAFAATTRFGRRIAHGSLSGALISAVLGTQLPGNGTLYLRQNLAFRAPLYLGDVATAVVRVTHVRDDKPVIRLDTWVENQDGERIAEGEAVVLFPPASGA